MSENELIIKYSTQVISDPSYWPNISEIGPDGRLNVKGFSDRVRYSADMFGVNAWRVLTYLVKDPKIHKGLDLPHNRFFLPWEFDFKIGLYDYEKLNQIFFDNVKEKVKACNRMNSISWEVYIEACHHGMPESPHMKNKQGLTQWDALNKYSKAYIQKYLDTLDEARAELEEENRIYGTNYKFKVMHELCNEPRKSSTLPLMIYIYQEILKRKYKNNQIEWGVFHIGNQIKYNSKGELITTPLRVEFKNILFELGLYTKKNKNEPFKTIHDFGNNQAKLDEIQNMIKFNRAHHYSFSFDGEKPKPDQVRVEKIMTPIFEGMKKKGGVFYWSFETLYNGDLNGHSIFNDPINGFFGITKSHEKVFGFYPENYSKYPFTIYPPKPKGENMELLKKIEELEKKILEFAKILQQKQNLIFSLEKQIDVLEEKKKFVFFRKGFSFEGWNIKGLWKIIDLYVYISLASIIIERIIF